MAAWMAMNRQLPAKPVTRSGQPRPKRRGTEQRLIDRMAVGARWDPAAVAARRSGGAHPSVLAA
jgi:hypothetical protein